MEISLASFKARFTYDPQKDLLGKGGYSEVYKAYDNDYKTDVALKIYQGDYSSQYNLLNEIRKYRRLQHAHVIQHLEAFEVNTGSQDLHGNPIKYQVGILEYANAGTLADLIKQGQLKGSANAAKLESIAKDIISGLEYLHSQNIIHRDLKPSNILLFKQGEKLIPKICDFGIAKVMDNATAVSTQLVGTVEYMAPEYFRTDLGDIGKASDLWSLGVILFEAATGQHPFGKASEG
jgi:serine/threonine protein kinase